MSASLSNILGDINRFHDLQRQSRFYFYIPGKNFPYLRCESVDMPGRSLDSFDHRTYGPIVKYPKQSTFGEVTATFIGSSNLANKNQGLPQEGTGLPEKVYFENWMQEINPYPTTSNPNLDYPYHNFAYKDDYVEDIFITCYDSSDTRGSFSRASQSIDNESFVLILKRAYPIMISSIGLNWASEDIVRFTVSFAYEWFTYTQMRIPAPTSETFDLSTVGEAQIANRSIIETIADLFN